jgi:CheY-like chemotaxis protein
MAQHKMNLLLAEDNPGDVFLVRRALDAESVPYELVVARDGEEAITYIANADSGGPGIDLLLVDLNLPKHDGTEVLSRLRNSKVLGHVPIIVLTSSDSPRDRERCLDLGANQYFQKPSDLERYMKLGSVVKTLMGSLRQDSDTNRVV